MAGVDELQLPRLFRHGSGDLPHAVSNKIHCGGAGKVEVALALGIPHVHAFATHGRREGLVERPPENGGVSRILKCGGISHVLDYPAHRA